MKSKGALLGAALLAALVGCAPKPSHEACEKAVENIRRLTGDTHTEQGPEQRAAVRSCQAQSSREIAECYSNAQTKEQLFTCGGELAESVLAAERKRAAEEPRPVPGTAGAGAGDTPHPPPAAGNSAGPGASSSAPPPPASETPAGDAAEPSGSGATGSGTGK